MTTRTITMVIVSLVLVRPGFAKNYLSITNTQAAAQAGGAPAGYWTPDRLKNAQELQLEPAAGFAGQRAVEESAAPSAPSTGAAGRGPKAGVSPDLTNQLFQPDPPAIGVAPSSDGARAVVPEGAGTFGAYFSSSRVFSGDNVYPYRAVGKLFFTIPGSGDYVCSASAVKPRLIVTAGHCVHSGTSAGFYTNWLFVPAFRNGAAPFGTWSWSRAIVTGTWAGGGGVVPNAADYALIELQDQVISSATRRIGDVTGWLGWQTSRLIPNHAHLLGYPCNFDSCSRMHQVAAGSFRAVSPNNVEYGSDMTGGSSGGPWVQNFGVLSTGQIDFGLNRVVGVTSYGYISPDPKVQGASVLDSRFVSILNSACAFRAGNC